MPSQSSISNSLPAVLAAQWQQNLQQFADDCGEFDPWLQRQLAGEDFCRQLSVTWLGSQYTYDLCLRRPELLQQLVDDGELGRSFDETEMAVQLTAELAEVDDDKALDRQLRLFRQRQMLRIIWRDFNRLADTVETTRDISLLAAVCVQAALDFHHEALSKTQGRPMATINDGRDGELVEQRMLILGMGKLGAYELNLSSDIDLIFCYPERGETVGGKRVLDNQQFFTRVGQRLIQSIDAMTADGFVFRVDMRLRPYGDSGALVLNFDAMVEYYQDQGRDWERYAMVKARVIAGPPERAFDLMAMLRPFTYRRYIDFSAIENLRDMKRMISQEMKRRGLGNDVKLGPGGIREVEFIVQSFQLIRGGRETELQERAVLKILALLAQKDYMPAAACEELAVGYRFLRDVEHGIQGYADRQTQSLPEDDYPRAVLAHVMGCASWDEFEILLQQHRDRVQGHFNSIFADDEGDDSAVDDCWSTLWEGLCLAISQDSVELNCDNCRLSLVEAGHEDADEVSRRLTALAGSQQLQRLQTIGRERLNQFMPRLLQAVAEADKPSQALLRILPLVESVMRRSAYLLLLVENPGALGELVRLCAASPWISSQLARHPSLLDELLNTASLYTVPEKAELRSELQQQVLRLNEDDLEAHMETLRYFRLAHILKVAASEISGRLPLMKVSDYLTWIAEVVLEHVLELAWHNLVAKHGYPQRACPETNTLQPCERDFIVVGYGKMGGIELGYGSDLDLVFIHDVPSGLATDGGRPIDNGMFFTRLGQRMIHILTAQTSLGMLYEVDMRLRPSGASGLLVSSLVAFEQYQRQEAWTWEHQALVRARVVAGDTELAAKFEQVRNSLLAQPRDHRQLAQEVVSMRQKMRENLLPKGGAGSEQGGAAALFPVKQGLGGIVDIEFMVQYAVLAWSQQQPSLAVYTDNIRILEALQKAGLFEGDIAEALAEAYRVYRSSAHRLSLQQEAVAVPAADVAEHRQQVQRQWQRLFADVAAGELLEVGSPPS